MLFAVRLKRMQDLAEETGEKMADIMDCGAPPVQEEEPEVVPKEPSVEPPPEEVHPSTPPATVGSEAPPNTPFPAVSQDDPELQERLSDLEEQLRGAAAARDDLQRELAEAPARRLNRDYEARPRRRKACICLPRSKRAAGPRRGRPRVPPKGPLSTIARGAAAAAAAAARE